MTYFLAGQLTTFEKTNILAADIHILMVLRPELEEKASDILRFGIKGAFKACSINENPDMLRRYETLRHDGYLAERCRLLSLEGLDGQTSLMIPAGKVFIRGLPTRRIHSA